VAATGDLLDPTTDNYPPRSLGQVAHPSHHRARRTLVTSVSHAPPFGVRASPRETTMRPMLRERAYVQNGWRCCERRRREVMRGVAREVMAVRRRRRRHDARCGRGILRCGVFMAHDPSHGAAA